MASGGARYFVEWSEQGLLKFQQAPLHYFIIAAGIVWAILIVLACASEQIKRAHLVSPTG